MANFIPEEASLNLAPRKHRPLLLNILKVTEVDGCISHGGSSRPLT